MIKIVKNKKKENMLNTTDFALKVSKNHVNSIIS